MRPCRRGSRALERQPRGTRRCRLRLRSFERDRDKLDDLDRLWRTYPMKALVGKGDIQCPQAEAVSGWVIDSFDDLVNAGPFSSGR